MSSGGRRGVWHHLTTSDEEELVTTSGDMTTGDEATNLMLVSVVSGEDGGVEWPLKTFSDVSVNVLEYVLHKVGDEMGFPGLMNTNIACGENGSLQERIAVFATWSLAVTRRGVLEKLRLQPSDNSDGERERAQVLASATQMGKRKKDSDGVAARRGGSEREHEQRPTESTSKRNKNAGQEEEEEEEEGAGLRGLQMLLRASNHTQAAGSTTDTVDSSDAEDFQQQAALADVVSIAMSLDGVFDDERITEPWMARFAETQAMVVRDAALHTAPRVCTALCTRHCAATYIIHSTSQVDCAILLCI
jgi:hypothetical protein